MKNCPKVYNLMSLISQVQNTNTFRRVKVGRSSYTTIPARPLNFFSIPARLKAAWLVYTGKADAVIWPEDVKGTEVV